jgi:hypothetical protein
VGLTVETIQRPIVISLIASVALLLAAPAAAVGASAAMPALYKNCTNLNKKYPHGLGKANALDKTSDEPVTTFKRSTRLYKTAMSWNKRLDRDKDGIACEKL